MKQYIPQHPCYIKWPNDIYVRDCKIAGILINNTIGGFKLESSVIGIGLNINQTCFTREIKNPISLKHIAKKDFVLKDVLHDLLVKLDARYEQLQLGADLEQEYETSLYRYNVKTVYQVNGRNMSGTIKGVDSYGRLKVEINRKVKKFNHGEITFLI